MQNTFNTSTKFHIPVLNQESSTERDEIANEILPWKMLDLTPVAIQVLNTEGKYLYCNKRTLELFGVDSHQEIEGRTPSFFSPHFQKTGENSKDALDHILRQAFSHSSATSFWDYKRINGDIFPTEMTLHRLNYNGEDCLMVSIIDISDATNKINAMSTLIRDSPFSILTISKEIEMENFNDAYLKVTHYSPEEANALGFKGQTVLSRDGGTIKDAIANKEPVRGKFVCNFGSGIRHLEYSYIPILNYQNEVSHLYHVMVDRTDLVNKLNEFESLIAGSPAGIITMDPDTRILSANEAFSDISALPVSQLTSMYARDFKILEREGESVSDVVRDKKTGGGTLTCNFGNVTRDLQYSYIPIIDTNGNVVKIYTLYVDLTPITHMVDYLKRSVNLVSDYIHTLSDGNTDFSPKSLPSDEFTTSAHDSFVEITKAIDQARLAIERMVNDSEKLTDAAIKGNLTFRADSSLHVGKFKAIIEGINNTLDATLIPVHEAMRVSKEFSRYQFKARFNSDIKVQGDWVTFRDALDEIGNEISRVISVLSERIQDLSKSIEEANASVEEIASGTSEISSTMESISNNSKNGDESIEQIIRAMTDLNNTVSSVAQKADSVASLAQEANNFATDGVNFAKKSSNSMEEIIESAGHVDLIIKDINVQMGEIGKIVNLISDIANQTNLLSLNAAIEAARAGEAGRGFAVVAAEVKSLSHDSRKSANNISEMIHNLQTKAKSAGDAMESSLHVVHEGNGALSEMVVSFNQIAAKIEDIHHYTIDVAAASEEQAASVEEITASMQDISSFTHKTSEEVMMTSAAITQTSASLDQITQVVSEIVEIEDQVAQEISKFSI